VRILFLKKRKYAGLDGGNELMQEPEDTPTIYFHGLPYASRGSIHSYLIPEQTRDTISRVYETCPVFNKVCPLDLLLWVNSSAPIFDTRELYVDGQQIELANCPGGVTWSFIKRICGAHDLLYDPVWLATSAIQSLKGKSSPPLSFSPPPASTLGHIFWEDAQKAVNHLQHKLSHHGKVLLVGSLRRRQEYVNDIDLLVQTDSTIHELAMDIPNMFPKEMRETRLLGVLYYEDVIIELNIWLVSEPDSLGAAMLKFTGPKGYTIGMTLVAKRKGYKLNEYGLFKGVVWVAGKTERQIYEALGKEFKVPRLRGK
jgi:hypothetical protein